MDKNGWKLQIIEACERAGTNMPQYDGVIETLAQILETRDAAQAEFEADGGQVTIRTEYRGAQVLKKHPAIAVVHDCNTQALAYWKELGLTAKAFHAMQKDGFQKKEAGFGELLKNIGI